MPKIKDEIYQKIMDRQNEPDVLEDIIREHTQLREEGVSFRGECPVCHSPHGLSITPGKGFKCFACNDFSGYNAFHYLTKGFNIPAQQAVEELAQHLGILVEYEQTERPMATRKTKKSSDFCRRMLEASGLSRQDVTSKVKVNPGDSDARDYETFHPGSMTPKGDITDGDDAVIEYFDLDGNRVMFTPDKEATPRPYCRVRYQNPELHTDKKEGKAMKYRSPYGAPAFIYYPQKIRQAYQNHVAIDRLYIQEGEKKAEKACKHGILSVAVSGIQNIGDRRKQLPEDLVKLVEVCQVKEVVFLLDSDCMDLSHSLRVDVPVEQRPLNFFHAVRNFKDYFTTLAKQQLYVEILFGYVKKNDAGDKGIDDLLANTLKGKEDELLKDLESARVSKPMVGKWVQLYKITTTPDNKIKEIWHLQGAKEFATQYFNELKDLPEFIIGGRKYRFNEAGEFESAQPIEPDEQFWTETKKKDGSVDCYFDYDGAKKFLEHRGYFRHEKPNQEYEFVAVEGRIVKEVKPHQVADFMQNFAVDTLPKHVRNMLYKGKPQYFGPVSLSMLDYFRGEFGVPTRGTERLFFQNSIWEVTADGVKTIPYTQLGFYIWETQRKHFDASLTSEPLVHIQQLEDGWSCQLTETGRLCDFLVFLENTSNFTWRKKYSEITDQEKKENAQHLLSKLSAFGYMVATAKNKSISKAVIGMDGKQSEVGVSNGRSGKSLLGEAARQVVATVYKNGKEFSGGKFSPFVWDGVDERTRFVFIDDVQRDFDFESLFSLITGDWPVNPKGEKGFTIPWSRSPKIYLTTNHAAVGDGASFEDRQWLIAFSDFYNAKHKPIHDFGTHFFAEEWPDQQWNLFWNLVATCLRIYFKYGYIEAPGDRLEKRKLLQEVGEEFALWADEYYSPSTDPEHPSKLNQIDIPRKDIYDNFLEYIGPARRSFYNPKNFKGKLIKYCELRGYYFNPQRFHPETGEYEPDRNGVPSKDIKRNGTEYFTIGLPDFYEVHKADLLAKNGAELPLEINDEDLPE